MGRPQIEISKENFESLCNLQCTLEEIAGFFKCSPDTIENWCKRTYEEGFSDTFKKYSQNGKISLRRYQFRLAEKNASMAIWLGKQYLGQTDKMEIEQYTDDKGLEIKMVAPSEEDIERLKKIKEQLFKDDKN